MKFDTRSVSRWPLLLVLAALPACAAVTIQLDPAPGNLSAAPGQTVGWGFTITSSTEFLVPSSVVFLPASGDGVFTDLLGPRFSPLIVGPGPLESPTVTELFDALAGTGMASFAVNAAAPLNSFINGTILVGYDLFSVSPNDPSFDPGIHIVQGGLTASLDASVFVTEAAEVPEPAALPLTALAAAAFAARRRWRPGYEFLPRK